MSYVDAVLYFCQEINLNVEIFCINVCNPGC